MVVILVAGFGGCSDDTSPTASNPGPERIFFVSNRDGDKEIFRMDRDGGQVAQITDDTVEEYYAHASDDGQSIAFTRWDGEDVEIWTMNTDASDQVQLTSNTAGEDRPRWSRDGTKLCFATDRDGNAEIYVMKADGTSQRNITKNPADDELPSWRP
jgi:Tol biopolymer transport system component